MSVGRNEPCPCGSGKKYKRCCWLVDQSDVVPVDRTGYRSRVFALVLTLVGMSVAGITAWLRTPREGLIVALGIAFVVGLFLVLRRPPPSSGGNRDPAGMNFGRKR